jgi:LCP family protein required for cell wall assembly
VAAKDKPYKLYRGGRTRGPVRPLREQLDGGDGKRPKAPADGAPKPRRRRRWKRIVLLVVLGLIVFMLVWATLGYLAVNRGVKAANERLPDSARAALSEPNGSLLTTSQNILLLGADNGGAAKDRQGTGRSDSIMIVRTDPDRHRLAYLSLPRDLYVPIPGHGNDKINAAYAYGGPALAIETVENLTGIPINHVIVVDFSTFPSVIDAVGGITVFNPKRILSNPFDCPLKGAEECATFKGWSFNKGEIELNGKRALVYARIRENQLDPGESDITRAERQQRVVQGLTDKIVGVGGFFRMPFIGDDVVEPLAMDLSTLELLELTWVRWRASDKATLRCRLGGTPSSANGASILQLSEDNPKIVDMVTNPDAAPQPPPKGQPFAPGCFVGRAGG